MKNFASDKLLESHGLKRASNSESAKDKYLNLCCTNGKPGANSGQVDVKPECWGLSLASVYS